MKAWCSLDQEKQRERQEKGAEMVQLYAPEGGQAELRPLNLQTPGHGTPRSRGPVDVQRNIAPTKVAGGRQDEDIMQSR